MLTVLSALIARKAQPEVEAIDRDPGIVTFLATVARSARRGLTSTAAGLRASHQQANEAALFSSSSAWPYNHRSH